MTDDGHPSILDLIRNADAIIAADDARRRARTVQQQPWPADGTLPVAEHVQLDHDAMLWTGHAYGIAATVTAPIPGPTLYVKPTVERNGPRGWLGHVRLVTAEGKVWAHSFLTDWWWV